MNTTWTNLLQFQSICETNSLAMPAIGLQGLEALEIANTINTPTQVRALDLTPEQMASHIRDTSIRMHQSVTGQGEHGYDFGLERFRAQVWDEVREGILPDLDRLVTELRPRFKEAVKPLEVGAQKFGFTYRTSSDDVINMRDAKAAAAWYDVSQAWSAAATLGGVRMRISELFDVSPTVNELDDLDLYNNGESIVDSGKNWSVCFAAGESWSTGGAFMIERKGSLNGLDWLAIAAGGLTLNTPTEVRKKISARRAAAWQNLPGAKKKPKQGAYELID